MVSVVAGRLLESGPIKNDLWWIGVLIDVVATLAGTGGKQLLRYAAVSKNPWFYPLGLICTAMIDPAFDLSAYGFAAQSIIAPCAGMVVVWNVLLAPCTLNERLTRSRLTGALLICVGTICVGLYGSHDDVERSVDEYLALFVRPAAVVYYAIFAVWMGACVYMYKHGSPFVSGFAMGALGGSFAGNMFTTKAVVEMFKCVVQDPETAEGCDSNLYSMPSPALPHLSLLRALSPVHYANSNQVRLQPVFYALPVPLLCYLNGACHGLTLHASRGATHLSACARRRLASAAAGHPTCLALGCPVFRRSTLPAQMPEPSRKIAIRLDPHSAICGRHHRHLRGAVHDHCLRGFHDHQALTNSNP